MATKSVTPAPAQKSNPELANTEHWLGSAWSNNPLSSELKYPLKRVDMASKGAHAIVSVLHRDFLARIDLADNPEGLTYPLLKDDEHDRLFGALHFLIERTEDELDRIRENIGGLASRASKEKVNG